MTTKLFGEPVQRVEDAGWSPAGRTTPTTSATTRSAAAFVRSPHAHARIVDIDVTDALDVDGLVAIYTYDDLLAADETEGTAVAEPLPLLIPHPALHAPRTGYALARDEVNHVGEAVVMVVAATATWPRTPPAGSSSTTSCCPPVVGVDNARRAERAVHDDVPDNVAAHNLQEVGDVEAAMAAAPHTLELDLDIERSASMPMEGKGVLRPLGRRRRLAAGVLLDPDLDRACGPRSPRSSACRSARSSASRPIVGGGFGVKIVHPWPEEMLVPWAAMRLGHAVKWVEDRREHFVSSAHERGQLQHVTVGLRRRGPDARARRAVLARQRRLHAVRHHRADHHLDPAARPVQAGRLPGASSGRSTPTP